MKLRHWLIIIAAIGVCVGVSCAAGNEPTPTAAGAGGGSHGSGTGGESFVTGGASCETHCSADLRTILDCNDQVMQTCPADQGCGTGGTCVPACESAEQNQSTIGCDYYAVFLNSRPGSEKWCFAAFIVNTWDAPVTLHVEHAGQTLDAASFSYLPAGAGKSLTYEPLPNGQLPPGGVAITFLSNGPLDPTTKGGCPSGVDVGFPDDNLLPAGTAISDAYHIITSAPVAAYDIFPYGGGDSAVTSATLLLPTSAWDTNYIAVNAYKQSKLVLGDHPTIGIVAAQDDTTVTIKATVPIEGGNGVAPAPANTPTEYKLDKGQFLQLSQRDELTGSVIKSDKPVGHWGGTSCINIPLDIKACDSVHQQIPPIRALGHEYVGVRYRNRIDGLEEAPPWRLVGAVDGTTLTWDPSPPPGAPTSLDQGQLVEFDATGPLSVKSQDDEHPFYMAAYMSGCGTFNSSDDCPGDPEFVNVIAPEQYLSSYVFFTDPTYPETNLVLIRTQDDKGFHDVNLDCAGTIGGWQPVGSAGKFEYARIDLVRHNFEGQNGCDNGRHEIKSDGSFGLTVWGWGSAATEPDFQSQAVSYAYPAGARVRFINEVVVPPEPK